MERKTMLLPLFLLVSAIFIATFVNATPPSNIPAGFVNILHVEPTIIVEMRYTTIHNFVGANIMGYDAPNCILSVEAAKSLSAIQQKLLAQNMTLKVYDCYRPVMAVQQFMLWSSNPDTLMKGEFYPDLQKDQLFPDGYIAANSSHSRGSTVDLTIVPLPAGPTGTYKHGDPLHSCYGPYELRFLDNGLDMGTGFDCFNEKAYISCTNISTQAYKNRMTLQTAMVQGGFEPYQFEWWHFTLKNEPYPTTYFNFPVTD